MKISRVINCVPVEFELTPQEEHELFQDMNLRRIKENILYLLNDALENEDPDSQRHQAVATIKSNLLSCPIFFDRVAKQYDDLRDEALDMEADYDIFKDAYKYMLKCWEVKGYE